MKLDFRWFNVNTILEWLGMGFFLTIGYTIARKFLAWFPYL